MIKVLADAELILEFFLNRNEYAQDAERLLEMVESGQIELYITELCLDKVRSEDKFRAKPDAMGSDIAGGLEKKFFGYVIPYNNCLIGEQVFQSIENTRNFECAVETACAIAEGVGAVVTHKREDFAACDLLVWSVTELSAITSLGDFVCQVLLYIRRMEDGSFYTSPPLDRDKSSIRRLYCSEVSNINARDLRDSPKPLDARRRQSNKNKQSKKNH